MNEKAIALLNELYARVKEEDWRDKWGQRFFLTGVRACIKLLEKHNE